MKVKPYIDLIKKYLEGNKKCRDFDSTLFRNLLKEEKNPDKFYYPLLEELERALSSWWQSSDYSDEKLNLCITETLAGLEKPLRVYREEEYERQRQLEQQKYEQELPLRLIYLLAEAEKECIRYSIKSTIDTETSEQKFHVVLHLYNHGGYSYEVKVYSNGLNWELENAKSAIEEVKETRLKELEKQKLIKEVKAKLTAEELKLLGIDS